MTLESSSLVTIRSGTANPVPRKRVRVMADNVSEGQGQGEGRYRVRPTTQKAQIQASQAAVISHPMPRQVSQMTASGVSHIGHQSSGRSRWRSTTDTPLEPALQRLHHAGAETLEILPSRNPDQVPYHAGGAPAVVIGRAHDEPVVLPGQGDYAVAADPGQLVRLGRGVHDLEAVEPSLHQRVEPLRVVPLVLGQRGDGDRSVERVGVGQELQEAGPVAPVGPSHRVDLPAEQHDMRAPGAHFPAAAQRDGHIGRDQAGGRVVIGQKDGVESGPLVPLEIAPGVEARHRGPADVVRLVGVAVEVHRREVPRQAGQLHHRPVGEKSAGDEDPQDHHRNHERPQLGSKRERPAEQHPPGPPEAEQDREAQQETA